MQTTQAHFTSLSGIKKKTSLDYLPPLPPPLPSKLPLSSSTGATISSNFKTKPNVPLQQLQNTNTNPNTNLGKNSYYNRVGASNSSTTSESDSDRETRTTNSTASLSTTNTNTSNKTSAFFKTRKKDKLKIRFELEPESDKWDPVPGSGKYTKYPSGGDTFVSTERISSGNFTNAPTTSSTLTRVGNNNLSYNSQTLLGNKPKRSKSLKKILTKSRSFIGLGGRDSSISRAELVAKYKQKSDANLLKHDYQGDKRWNNDKDGQDYHKHSQTLCKNCGTSNLELQKTIINKKQPPTNNLNTNTPKEKSWLGMAMDGNFPVRYTKLPSDHGEFLSLNYYRMYQQKDYGDLKNNSNSINCNNSSTPKRAFKAPANAEMARVDYQDQYNSYYDCRIPRPKLKFLVPTHSYGVSGKIGRKVDFDVSGFSEISLSDGNDNEDAAYGSGSGSGCSSRIRSENSSDETISEFEKEQERISGQDDRDYISQVERVHSAEENSPSPLGQFPKDYNTLYNCEKGIVVKGSSRRLLSFKKAYLPNLRSNSTKSSTKAKLGEHTDFLKTLPIFRKLSSGFLTKLSDNISQASYDCGEYIIRQGSRGEAFVILMSGTAKVTFLSNQTGDEIYLRTMHPGDCFGEKSLQGDRVNMLNLIANDENVSCILISEEGFEQLMAKSGDFRQRFTDKIITPINKDKDVERIELEDLRLISTLGIGGFGRVELVTLARDTSRSFALKQMKKCQIVGTRQVEHIKSEKAILMETNCDFITKLYATFKDAKYLYMLMEANLGGELWTILRDRGNFDDATARFYVGCVLEALKYLHSRNIIYRDLKPENLLLDNTGYVKLVDFGFAKKLQGRKTWTFCGTPEYVAPEIILNKGHDITADYWSLGVLMYELLTGTPPFVGGDPMRTYKLILKGVEFIDFPETIGKNAYSLIRKLCQENPLDRLGAQRGGISDIKKHKWLDGLDWNGIKSRSLIAPIIPFVKGPHDCGNFDEYPPDRSGTPPDDISGWDYDF